MKKRFHSLLSVCVSLLFIAPFSMVQTVHAQVVPDSYRQQKQMEMNQFADSIHDEFVRYLEHLWTEYQLFEGELFPLDNKPVTQPHLDTFYLEDDTLKTDRLMHYGELNTIQESEEQEFTPPAPTSAASMRNYVVPFYGRRLSIAASEKVAKATLSGIRERQVAHYWKQLVECQVDQCVASLHQHRRNLYLNDWGFFDLIRHFSTTLLPNRPNEQAVFSVFLLDAMHFDARVGRMGDNLVMLVNTGNRLYEIPYVEIDSQRYYLFGNLPRQGRIFTYDRQMAHADRPVDLHLTFSPRLGGALSAKAYSTTLNNQRIEFRVNQPLMDFYAGYPSTELAIYASAAMEEAFAAAIARQLHPLLKGQNETDALNTLLLFMQQGFAYQTDSEQFGREKNFFCEENFYYPANDCEDRAILFARIVKNLLGYEVVLLEYDDHVATAVNLPHAYAKGHHLNIQGKRFTVCDPTCIGATVGDISSKYLRMKANVITL